MFVYRFLNDFKIMLENAIIENGEQGFSNIIRSQKPINCIHEIIKHDLVRCGVDKNNISTA